MDPLSSPILPLLGSSIMGLYAVLFLFQMFLGGRLRGKGNAVVVGVNALVLLLSLTGWMDRNPRAAVWQAAWADLPTLNLEFNWDAQAGGMVALVAFINLLVVIYSTAYMRGEEERQRYWAYLSLFTGSMMGLVLAGNLLTLFLFWELVGVSSWLLIGYWRNQERAARGSFKAFVVNRAADVFFLIGICLLFKNQQFGGGNPYHIMLWSDTADPRLWAQTPVNWGLLFLFLGAAGKSAQFPFQAWLPDAMSGPTPVSSLLHAATMVAAGVYIMVRVSVLMGFQELEVVAITGAVTAVVGAFSALGQHNIKRVLAFSTVSQLGLMMFGIGAGNAMAADFHLTTHAFFKCGLFLSAGAVIHSLHHYREHHKLDFDEEDMRQMGGLRRAMPRTFWVYVVFAASLAGLPLTSGFLSKEGILQESLHFSHALHGWGLLATLAVWSTVLLTPLYMTRHGLLIFGGRMRLPGSAQGEKPKDAPLAMWLPLLALAIASTALVWEVMHFLAHQLAGGGSAKGHAIYKGGGAGGSATQMGEIFSHGALWPLVSIAVALLGVALGWLLFRKGWSERTDGGLLMRASRTELHWDKVYDYGVARPALLLARAFDWVDKRVLDGIVNGIARGMVSAKESAISLSRLAWRFDTGVVDWLVNGLAQSLWRAGGRLRRLQSGKLQGYLALSLLGLLLLLGAFIYFAAR